VLALQSVVLIGTTPIGGPILGLVCDAWGPRAGLVLAGTACLFACALGLAVAARHAAVRSRRSVQLDPTATRASAAEPVVTDRN
jgi:hypothetical protein